VGLGALRGGARRAAERLVDARPRGTALIRRRGHRRLPATPHRRRATAAEKDPFRPVASPLAGEAAKLTGRKFRHFPPAPHRCLRSHEPPTCTSAPARLPSLTAPGRSTSRGCPW